VRDAEGETAPLAILAFPFASLVRHTARSHTTVTAFDATTVMVV
jgi:hypothetical protein